MPCRRPALLAVVLAAALLSGAAPVAANFGDCNAPAWRAAVDPRLATIDYDCVEALRLPVATAEGERQIRVLHDREAGWVLTGDLLAEVRRGLEGAAAAFPQLGPFRMNDVTLLLADDLPPGVGVDGHGPPEGEILAQTALDTGDECVVVFYLLGGGAGGAYAATSIVHEIFHCLQDATLDPAQMGSGAAGTGGGGDWWIEGSAEWFTALALPDAGLLPERAAAFDADSAARSLNDMAYGAAMFFLWLGEAQGPAAILPFLHAMAPSPAAGAQWSAMGAALPAGEWLRFAEDYRDSRIHHPHGTALALSPQPGEITEIDAPRRVRFVVAPFQLLRGTLDLACGRWRVTSESPQVQFAERDSTGGDWQPLPLELTVPEGERYWRDFVAVNATGGRRPLVLNVERLATCEPCAGTREIDSCLVGAWQQVGGGPVEWMRSTLPPEITIPSFEQSDAVFVLRPDGSYFALPLTQQVTILLQQPDGVARAEGAGLAQGAGRWSALEGRLNLCQDSGGLLGSMTMTFPTGDTVEQDVSTPGEGTLVQAYSCAADSLTTSLDFGHGLPPMTTDYQRLAP